MKKAIVILILTVFMFGCSASVDTTNMTAEEHFEYAMSLYNEEDYEKSINEFQAILLQFPGNQITDDAQFYLGMSYYKSGQYLLGAYEFSKLIRDIPGSEFVDDAQFMLADSYFQLSPPYPLDQSYTEKAIDEFQAFIDFFPTDKRVKQAEEKIQQLNTKLAEKEYMDAVIYEKMEYFRAAIKYYTNVTEKFHDTKFAPLASYRKIKLLIQTDKKDEALKEIKLFLARYKNDANYEEVKKLQTSLEMNS